MDRGETQVQGRGPDAGVDRVDLPRAGGRQDATLGPGELDDPERGLLAAEGNSTLTASGYSPVAAVVPVTAGGASTTEIALTAPVLAGAGTARPTTSQPTAAQPAMSQPATAQAPAAGDANDAATPPHGIEIPGEVPDPQSTGPLR